MGKRNPPGWSIGRGFAVPRTIVACRSKDDIEPFALASAKKSEENSIHPSQESDITTNLPVLGALPPFFFQCFTKLFRGNRIRIPHPAVSKRLNNKIPDPKSVGSHPKIDGDHEKLKKKIHWLAKAAVTGSRTATTGLIIRPIRFRAHATPNQNECTDHEYQQWKYLQKIVHAIQMGIKTSIFNRFEPVLARSDPRTDAEQTAQKMPDLSCLSTGTGNCGGIVATTVELSATIHRRYAAFCRKPYNPLIVFEPKPQYEVGRREPNDWDLLLWFQTGSLLARCSSWARLLFCSCDPACWMTRQAVPVTRPNLRPRYPRRASNPATTSSSPYIFTPDRAHI